MKTDIQNFIHTDDWITQSILWNLCYLRGECGDDRFKGVETPPHGNLINSIVELNKIDEKLYKNKKTCAIVGNSSILIEKEYGQEIDDHDVVIRCNLGRTTGFEKHTGSKTTFRFIAAKSFTRAELLSHSEYDFNFLPSLNGEHFFIRYDAGNTMSLIGGMVNNYKGNNNIHYLNSDFISKCDELKNGYSSIGYISVIFATQLFENVSLYGFNFFKEEVENSHYFEKVREGTTAGHNFDSEENIILQLQDNDTVKIYR